MKISKKIILAIVIILVVVLLGVGGYFGIEYIKINNKIKETEKKLSSIDIEKLEEKLIEEIKKTDLYTLDYNKSKGELFVANIEKGEQFEDYITLKYVGKCNGEWGAVEIPLFKINSDSNGKFKNIYYNDKSFFMSKLDFKIVLSEVLKNEYNIDIHVVGNFSSKYYDKFYKWGNIQKGNIYVNGKQFYRGVYKSISGDTENTNYGIDKYETEYYISKFGL